MKILGSFLIFLMLVCAQAPFSRGVNLTGWFSADSPGGLQFSRYDKEDFLNIKSLGADVIRLPINLHKMTSGYPEYKLDPVFLYFINKAVDLAEETKINIILDNHSDQLGSVTPDSIDKVLVPVWKQMAQEFSSRSSFVHYEILNEPRGISDTKWNEIQQKVIDAIRVYDKFHYIIAGPSNWNSFYNLKNLKVFNDPKIIYTFHFYDPFLFTHQGASWTDPSMVALSGMPFPYSAAGMPSFPASLKGTWIESNFNNYKQEGTVEKVKALIDIAKKFKTDNNVILYCGEFGVYMPNSANNDRIVWYELVRKYLEESGISWTIWDYHGGFGVFHKNTAGLFNQDLNIALLQSLGFNTPDQNPFTGGADTTEITIYNDYYGKHIYSASSIGKGTLNLYDNTNPAGGNYSIYTTGIHQYGMVSFDFIPDKDLSYLKSKNFSLKIKIKGDTPGSKLDLRFIDTKTNVPGDHPWRMRYTVDESVIKFDNIWHELNIPLKDFKEQGAYDNNQWYNPEGLYDWQKTDRFDIVAEHHSLENRKFWFDDIKITATAPTSVNNTQITEKFRLDQNYPNPFNPSTNISFFLAQKSYTNLTVYNMMGEKIKEFKYDELPAGKHNVILELSGYASGIYFYRLKTEFFEQSKKCIMIK